MKKPAIFGPPGTGKPTRVTHEIEQRVRPGVRSDELTFTRAAAGVLAQRVNKRNITFLGTVHSLAFHALGLERSQVATSDSFIRACDGILEDIEQSLAIYAYADRNGGDLYEAYSNMQYGPQCVPFAVIEYYITAYRNWKESNLLFDFDDMLRAAVGKAEQFDVVIVDEAQDLSKLQWEFILSLVKLDGELLLAGDDDQSIFAWSGAYSSGMVEIADTYDILSQSYRIPPELQVLAEATVGQIINRVPKVYLPREGRGEINYYGDYNPMLAFKGEDHTVLCRSQWGMKKIERQLIEMAVPYLGNRSVYNSTRADLMRAIHNEDDVTVRKLVRYLTPMGRERFEQGKIPHLHQVDCSRLTQDEYDYLQRVDLFADSKVTLSTIHSFKGEEADHVVLICDCSYIVESAADTQLRFEDEVRVWYVGLTRARHRLDIVGYNQFILV
jgi:superfamily I DNA/RNA helicase